MLRAQSHLLFSFLLAGALLLSLTGCDRQSTPTPSNFQTYTAHGLVRAITLDRRTVTIKHDAIPGYMGAMTMDFTIKDTNAMAGISTNDEIYFDLLVTTNDDWIQNIRLIAHHISDTTNDTFVFHVPSPELKVGDVLPDYTFTTEYGTQVKFSDFHGRALAFTFFFTSCPLPDFCPRMNRNFAEVRKALTSDPSAPTNWDMLSISFDPTVDQPAVLSGYATFYRGQDTNHWLFAVAATNTLSELAPKVDLQFWHEGGSISHNLRTVVVDVNRRITAQLDGNDWAPEDLISALRSAAQVKPD